MAAVDPKGTEKYWVDGHPFAGINNPKAKTGGEKYWVDGAPVIYLYPPSAAKSSFFLVFE